MKGEEEDEGQAAQPLSRGLLDFRIYQLKIGEINQINKNIDLIFLTK